MKNKTIAFAVLMVLIMLTVSMVSAWGGYYRNHMGGYNNYMSSGYEGGYMNNYGYHPYSYRSMNQMYYSMHGGYNNYYRYRR